MKQQYTLMTHDPVTGEQRPYPSNAHQYREYHGACAWLFDPWSGTKRHPMDIGNDVLGNLIIPDGEPIFAATDKHN